MAFVHSPVTAMNKLSTVVSVASRSPPSRKLTKATSATTTLHGVFSRKAFDRDHDVNQHEGFNRFKLIEKINVDPT